MAEVETTLHSPVEFMKIATSLSSKKVVVKRLATARWAIFLRGQETAEEVGLASAEAPAILLEFASLDACVTAALELSGAVHIFFE